MERKNTHFFGKAAEYFVAGHLLSREIPVSFPVVDTGIDLIAGNGIRIQVKAVRKRRSTGEGYCFTLASRVRLKEHDKYRLKIRDWSKEIDFLILWGAEENRFWILPTRIFNGRQPQTILVGSVRHRKQVDHDKVRELHKNGMGPTAISKHMGISLNCAYECIRGRTKGTYSDTIIAASESDQYENAWHEIEAALGLVNQIDEPVEFGDSDALKDDPEIQKYLAWQAKKEE